MKRLKALLVLLAVVLMVTLACEPAPTVPPVPVESTALIQTALEENGYFYVGRNYIVNGTITPPQGSEIVFGPGGQFTRTPEAPVVGTLPVILLDKGNVTITNPRIVGPNPCYWSYFDTGYKYSQYDPKREWNHAISIVGGSNYLIENPNITSVWGDAINIDRGPQNITINNLKANCVGRSIISNTGSTNVIVNGGEAHGAFWWTFNIEPFGSRVVRDYEVNNFIVGFSRGQAIFSGGPDFNCQVYNVDFNNLTYTTPYRQVSIKECVASQITIK